MMVLHAREKNGTLQRQWWEIESNGVQKGNLMSNVDVPIGFSSQGFDIQGTIE